MTYEKRNEIITRARALMNQHGLHSWRFQWDRSKRRFGVCMFRHQIISISEPLASLNSVERVLQTVLHEIAHALAGHAAGHGWAWKRVAMSIGCPPERCYSSSEVVVPQGRYKLTCPNCKKETQVHRRTRKVKACGACCRRYSFGRFDAKYTLQWSVAI